MRFKNIGFAVLCLSLLTISSCRSFRHRVAENYYEQNAFAKAIPRYEQVLGKEFDLDAANKVADCYRQTGNSLKAEFWYRRIVNSGQATPAQKLALGECLMENGKYQEASTWLNQYLQLNSSDSRVKRLILACDSIHLFFQDTTAFMISVPAFNKGYESNFSPIFYRDGIVFLSDRSAPGKNRERSIYTGKEFLDLFYTRSLDGKGSWMEPELFKGDVNGPFDEGSATFNSTFSEMYFTRSSYSGDEEQDEKAQSLLKIFNAKIEGNLWKVKGEVDFNSPDYSVGHPALSPDGKTIYFVSDMPWGYGGTDIYSITYTNGRWGKPVNLGNKINTEGNEMFPFVAADGVLYFASDGMVGMGGLDIYEALPAEEGWNKPENLQYPVNSSKDDFGFIIDSAGVHGFFTSARNRNTDQIYEFRRNPPVVNLSLNVLNTKGDTKLRNAKVEVMKNGVREQTVTSGPGGIVALKLSANAIYTVDVKPEGYFKTRYEISTAGLRKSKNVEDSLHIGKIELKKRMNFPSVYFPAKKTELTPSIKSGLDSLVTIMMLNPELQIEIASHTDSKGAAADNLKISIERSDELSYYLISKGVAANRIISMGYGESRLLNNCRDGILCLEEDHKVNNRVEIKVIDLLKP